MITVTVCDDCEEDLAKIKKELEKYKNSKHTNMQVSYFHSPEALLFELDEKKVSDIYILDVAMPKINGFQVAKKIRSLSTTSVILFLTTVEDLAPKGYRYKALRYIIKFNLQRDFTEAMDSAVSELEDASKNTIMMHYYTDYWRVPYKDIVFVTKAPRQVIVTTTSLGELSDPRGIQEFYNALNDNRFIFIDRSCFVNIDYISRIIGYSVVLTTEHVLPVSRRSMQNLKSAIMLQWKI